jgi:hypothetical protein
MEIAGEPWNSSNILTGVRGFESHSLRHYLIRVLQSVYFGSIAQDSTGIRTHEQWTRGFDNSAEQPNWTRAARPEGARARMARVNPTLSARSRTYGACTSTSALVTGSLVPVSMLDTRGGLCPNAWRNTTEGPVRPATLPAPRVSFNTVDDLFLSLQIRGRALVAQHRGRLDPTLCNSLFSNGSLNGQVGAPSACATVSMWMKSRSGALGNGMNPYPW